MPLQNFVNYRLPAIGATWLNEVDVLKFSVFNDAATKPAARTALELTTQLVAVGTDAGAANAAVVTLLGPVTGFSRSTGVAVAFLAAAANTGAATLNVNGTGAAAVINQLGNALTGGELSVPVIVQWTGVAWKIVQGAVTPDKARSAAEIAAAVVPTDYTQPRGDIRRYGGVGDGVTNNATALTNATAQGAQTNGAVVSIAGGVYRITANTTLAAGSRVDFTDGGSISVDALITLTINCVITASPFQNIFSGAGIFTLSKDANPRVWAAWFPGADIGAQINAAMTSVSKVGPLTIAVAAGVYNFSTKINGDGAESIRLTGTDTPHNQPSNRNPRLNWTGAAGSGVAVSFAVGALDIEIDHLTITYSNAAYNGNLISFAGTLASNVREVYVHNCGITGLNTAKLAARLVELAFALSMTFERCHFRYAVDGISCSDTSNNIVRIDRCWFDAEFTGKQIGGRGGNWKIVSTQGESGATLTTFFALDGELNGWDIDTCSIIDGGVGGGTLIDLTGAVSSGGAIKNCVIGAQSGTGILCATIADRTLGLSVSDNYINITTGLNMSAGRNIYVGPNRWNCTTAINCNTARRYAIAPQQELTGTVGHVLANTAVLVLSAAGGGDALCQINAIIVDDSAAATYFLAGAGAASAEVADPNGLFTNAAGGAASVNIYWSGGNNRYELQNNRGAQKTIIVNWMSGK